MGSAQRGRGRLGKGRSCLSSTPPALLTRDSFQPACTGPSVTFLFTQLALSRPRVHWAKNTLLKGPQMAERGFSAASGGDGSPSSFRKL